MFLHSTFTFYISTADKPCIWADKSDQNWSQCWQWRSSLQPGPETSGRDGGEGWSARRLHWSLPWALRCPGGGRAQSETPEQDWQWSSIFLEWYFQHVICNTDEDHSLFIFLFQWNFPKQLWDSIRGVGPGTKNWQIRCLHGPCHSVRVRAAGNRESETCCAPSK